MPEDVPSEKTQAKAAEYLLKGRVKVQHLAQEGAVAHFQADVYSASQTGDPYRVRFGATGWHCDCPARVSVCAHILACQTITDIQISTAPPPPLGTHADPDIDALLEGL